jgi:hypothetical protein
LVFLGRKGGEDTVSYLKTSIGVGVACLIPLSAGAQNVEWAQMPRMVLERQFAGPLQDTVIQRWRDPIDGTICYIYLPFTAPHTPPTPSGYVQYGSTGIGSLTCTVVPHPPPLAPRPRPKASKSPPKNSATGE